MFTLYRQSYVENEELNESEFIFPENTSLAAAVCQFGAEVGKYEDWKKRGIVDYWSLMLEWMEDGIIETVAIVSSTDVYYD